MTLFRYYHEADQRVDFVDESTAKLLIENNPPLFAAELSVIDGFPSALKAMHGDNRNEVFQRAATEAAQELFA